ncbi:response regulator [Nevskia sp.]|uniref:response regulator n=1 Tax=Nevskia sp. TaxID=1929292 RepID=UPI0025CE7144|nr:response regulator [Nevskia sp.]
MARVMVVDDSPTDKEFLKAALTRAGHSVFEATSGQDALALVRTLKVDCVVMDVVMPGMNGFQATRTMTRDPATAAIPVIVVSSKSQETDRVWALRQGAREYIVKPVQEAELVGKVQHVLGG